MKNNIKKEEEEEETDINIILTGKEINGDGMVEFEHFK